VDAQGIEPTSDGKFWSAISVDLTGVALVDFRPQPRIDRRRKFQTGDLHRRHLLHRGDFHRRRLFVEATFTSKDGAARP
jgi:hypothetical protein